MIMELNMSNLEDRIKKLEDQNELLTEKYKKVVKHLCEINNKINSTPESTPESTPKDLINPPDEWTCVYTDDKCATLYNEDEGLAAHIAGIIYEDNNLDDKLEKGEKYSDEIRPEKAQVVREWRMSCWVYSVYNDYLYVKYQNRDDTMPRKGILNTSYLNECLKDARERGAVTYNDKHDSYDLKQKLTLKCIPFFVERNGWKVHKNNS